MSMAAGARAGARLLQLRPSTPLSQAHSHLPVASSSLIPSRGFSADHGHGPPRVNVWEDPMSPSKWKEEHFVFVSLAGWFLLFYGGYKSATRLREPNPSPKPVTKSEPPPKHVAKAESVTKKKDEKPIAKGKENLVPKMEEIPAPKQKEENPARKMKEEKPAPKKDEKPSLRKEEKPAPGKVEKSSFKKKEEASSPKMKEDTKPELNSAAPKDKKGANHDKETIEEMF